MSDTDLGQRPDQAYGPVENFVLNDQPTPDDALGFAPYVEAVANFLTHRAAKPPLALSVEGDWGRGKSSFMMQLREELCSRGARTVWFDAWRHDKEDALWAAFALEFTRQLALKRSLGSRWWAHIKVLGLRFSWKDGWIDVLRVITLSIVVISALVVPLILLYAKGPEWVSSLVTQVPANLSWQDILRWALASGGIAGYIAIVATLLMQLRTFVGNPLAISLKQYVESPSYESYVGLIDRFHEDFSKIVKAYAGNETVYVFIDDLDRCEVPKAADLMQALNLMVSADATQVIFVMGMDREKIAASVAAKHENLLKYLAPMSGSLESPATTSELDPASGLEYGYAFVEKLVQLPFRVPQPANRDVQRLLDRATPRNKREEQHKSLWERLSSIWSPSEAENRQGEHGTNVLDEVTEDTATIRNIAEMVAPALDYNPRRFKQFMNLLRLRVSIASDTGLFERRDPRKNPWTPEKLGKFVAITLAWPRLVDSLDDDPNLLTALQVVALGREPENPNALLDYWAHRRSLLDLFRYEGPDGGETSSADKPSRYSLENVDVRAVLQVSPRTTRLPEADLQEPHFRAADVFVLRKLTSELRPEDIGFQVVRPEESVSPDRRPFYESAYISRIAVRYSMRGEEDPQPKYDEEALARSLREGRGFILQGPPLDGKTGTLYQVVKLLDQHVVLKPNPSSEVPDDDVLYRELRGKRVVLLLDDITQYIDAKLDLLEFSRRLSQHTLSWVVASECRDGPELEMVRNAESIGLRRFYEEIARKLGLLPVTETEKARLVRELGRLPTVASASYPNVGSIIMDTLTPMKERFEYLVNERPEQADVLRALQLLMYAGVLPYTHERLRAVLESVFERRTFRLTEALDALENQSFLQPGGNQDPVRFEPTYLRDVVTYVEGKNPQDDFAMLADALAGLNDYEGLLDLGATYAYDLDNYDQALACFDSAREISSEYHEAWLNKSMALRGSSRVEGALSATQQILEVQSDLPMAWANKSWLLMNLRRFHEALEAVNQALILKDDEPDIWRLKGSVLFQLGRWEEAIEAYDRALELKPDYPQAWSSKASALHMLERYDEALSAVDVALDLKDDDPEVWHLRGLVLFNLGRRKEAKESYDKIRILKSDKISEA